MNVFFWNISSRLIIMLAKYSRRIANDSATLFEFFETEHSYAAVIIHRASPHGITFLPLARLSVICRQFNGCKIFVHFS